MFGHDRITKGKKPEEDSGGSGIRYVRIENLEREAEIRAGRKWDLILVIVVLLTSLIVWGTLHVMRGRGDLLTMSCDGEVFREISLNGQEDRYYLILYEDIQNGNTSQDTGISKDKGVSGKVELIELTDRQAEEYIRMQGQEPDQESEMASIPADSGLGGEYNLFVCGKDGTVRMLGASCPDQICVNHKAINTSLENIICLPHRLVLEITIAEEDSMEGLDGIAY